MPPTHSLVELFTAATGGPPGPDRDRIVEELCAAGTSARRELDALLAAHDRAVAYHVLGFAMDFNSQLAVVSGYADLMLHEMGDGNPQREYASGILNAANHGCDLMRRVVGRVRRHQVPVAAAPLEDQPSAGAPHGTESVVLCEQEESIRALIESVLQSLGYQVTAVGSKADLAAVLDRPEIPVDLVISDGITPGDDGSETVAALRRQRPSVKVLFLLGNFADEALLRETTPPGEAAVLLKPFTPIQLATALRELLGVSPSPVIVTG